MDDLNEIREKIDAIDKKLIKLLNQRAKLGQKIAEVKRRDGAPVYHPARENEILKKITEMNSGPLPDSAVKNVLREVFSATRAVERELKVASLGPIGTFTHLAAIRLFGKSSVHETKRTFGDIFAAVEKGVVDYGVVPVENSIEGPVGQTMDLLASSPVTIYAEHFYPIRLTLMSKAKKLANVNTLYTHYMPLAQARGWIDAHLGDVEIIETSSTSEAAKLAAKDSKAATIGASEVADIYKLNILAERIEETDDNETRFFVLSMNRPPKGKRNKTSIVFTLPDEPGALDKVIHPFSDNKINMSKIQSRPSRTARWEYFFFVDISGHEDDKKVKLCLDKVAGLTKSLKVLGSYPDGAGE